MLPNVPYQQRRQEPQITAFRGVNYRPEPVDGELAAATNMSSRRYPFLSPREGRSLVWDLDDPHAAWAGDHLVFVDGTKLIYDGEAIGSVTASPKNWAAINSKLVIWPDRKYIDFNTGTLKNLEASYTSVNSNTTTITEDSITFTGGLVQSGVGNTIAWSYVGGNPDVETYQYIKLYDANDVSFADGVWTLANAVEKSAKEIYNMTDADRAGLIGKVVMVKNGDNEKLNVKTSVYNNPAQTYPDDPAIVKDYKNPDSEGNYAIITGITLWGYAPAGDFIRNVLITYDLHNADGVQQLNKLFSVGDAVRITGEGITDSERIIIRTIGTNSMTFDDGMLTPAEVTTPVTVAREVPDMDYICASENRLWGVSNAEEGEVYDRETGKTVKVYNRVIHASALGDPTNFYVYDGLSTDSYSVAVAEAGDFTGCIGYRGDVLFFKEDKIIRVAGDYPADYAMYVYDVPGISTGSWRSAQIINDILYYLSREGVQAWSGNEGELISYRLGDGPYLDGVAGTDGRYYYLSARGPGGWSLHVWDSLHNIWYREDDSHALDFCLWETKLHMLDSSGLWQFGADGEDVEWSAELAPSDESTHLRKNYRWIRLRLVIPAGSTVKLYVAFGEEDYSKWWETTPAEDFAGTVNIPMPPNRVDRIRVKLTGTGDCTLKDVVRAFNVGSLSTR